MLSCAFWWLGIFSFTINLVLHVLIWRSLKPKRDILYLFFCFIGVPLGVFSLTSGLGFTFSTPALLFHLLLSLNYIAIYPAFQASSPTVRLLELLRQSNEGMDRTELNQHLLSCSALKCRYNELLSGGLIQEKGSPVLSRPGFFLASFFLFYRKMLGLGEGVG